MGDYREKRSFMVKTVKIFIIALPFRVHYTGNNNRTCKYSDPIVDVNCFSFSNFLQKNLWARRFPTQADQKLGNIPVRDIEHVVEPVTHPTHSVRHS